jgi:signal peptidase II
MSTKTNIPNKIFLPIIAILMVGFVVLDQILKKKALEILSFTSIDLNSYLHLEISKNYGFVFGLSMNSWIFYIVFFILFFLLASGNLFSYKEMEKWEIFAVVCILSGALGNLIDRIRLGYIVDFINFNNLVIFNLADILIMIGAIILINNFFCKKDR